jgi:hypothetical protein
MDNKEKKVVSVANLQERFKIKDPFDKDFLMGLPREALISVLLRVVKEAFLESLERESLVDTIIFLHKEVKKGGK